MAMYWFQIGQTMYGRNTGYTEAEMMGFIAQKQVLADTIVNVDRTGWITAKQIPEFQQAIEDNEICPECLGNPYRRRCPSYCDGGLVNPTGFNVPREKLYYIGYYCRECDGSGYVTTCPRCGKKY